MTAFEKLVKMPLTQRGVVHPGDVLLSTALGVYQPKGWSIQDWVIDVGEKYIQAQATGFMFDRLLDPVRST